MIDKRIVVAVSFGLATSACGLVTGLSQDYTFDRDDASADGSASTDGATTADATPPDGATVDAGPSRDATVTDASRDGGVCANTTVPSGVDAECYSCLAAQCCPQLIACNASSGGCTKYVQCIEQCGKQNVSCYDGCKPAQGELVANRLATCAAEAKCAPDSCHK